MEKEGKVNIKFIASVLFLLLLMAFFVFSVGINLSGVPGNMTINTSRNINFTFTPTWNLDRQNTSNCSLWTNFTGTWELMLDTNGTAEGIYNESTNITNASTSWINYTFTHDIGLMVWDIACRNGTPGGKWLFNGSNRTLAIDTAAPKVVAGPTFYNLFNTTNETLTITINITDVNGTGVNLTSTANNLTLNFTLYNLPDTTPLKSYNLSNSSLSCDPSGAGLQFTQCSLVLSTFPLTNGTKNITVSVTDRAGFTNVSWFTFTVDQIAPALLWINLTDSLKATVTNRTGSIRQGQILYLSTNLTDNLTQPLNISLEWLNGSTWMVVNRTSVVPNAAKASREYFWGNATFTIPEGRNEFEGRNVSFRVVYNDTLGNSNNTDGIADTLIVQINDTYAPTIEITLPTVNGTNLSTTTLTVNWSVNENNRLAEINISVDGVGISTGFDPNICNKYIRYHTGSATNVEDIRNGTLTTNSGTVCGLTNGSHYVVVQATDIWGNSFEDNRTFKVQSGTKPGLGFNLTGANGAGTWIKNNVNKTNITSSVGITLFGANGVGASINKISYFSSCNLTAQVINNNTVIYPFNTTSTAACGTESENRTLTVTINDTAGNHNTTVLGFMVDNVGPTITVHNPTEGFSTTAGVVVNVSAFDGESQIEWIRYYLDSGFTSSNHTQNGSVLTGSFGQNATYNRTINFTAGTHTIKISVNDTLGNIRNSSWRTFTYRGPYNFLDANKSLVTAAPTNYSKFNYSKVRIFNSSHEEINDTRIVDQTLELFLALNSSGANINVSINFNGSAANWDALNFTIGHNDSRYIAGIENNFTAKIVELITFNTSSDGFTDSIDEFLTDSNSYYGFVDLALNATNMSAYGGNDVGGLGGRKYELWYFSDETALNSKVNITECTQNKLITHTTASSSNFPCWNNTLNKTVRIYVPHFSAIALVNDTRFPTVTINSPPSTQEVSGFIPNITVSFDAVSCKYIMNGTGSSASSNVSSTATAGIVGSNNICSSWSEIRFKNGVYNITYNVTDANGNINATPETARTFTMSDNTAPNSGTSISASESTTGATITISGVNESVNATIAYQSTGNTSFTGTTATVTAIGFSKTHSAVAITLSTVTSATLYYYNVTVCDYNGNCKQNTTVFTFTQTATAAAAAAAAAAAGGGGGGAVPVSTVAASQAQVWQTIPAGSSFSLDVDKAAIAITSVAVNEIKSELKNVEIEAAALTENPVSTEAAAKVYQYLRINKKNLADTDAGSFKIIFRVTKVWLTENSLASGDIALYRFKDVWSELATKVTGTDDTYVNYEAQTPGFSSFAIGTKSGVVVEEVPAEEVPPEEVVPPEEAAPPEAVEAPKGVEAPSKAPTAWIIAAVVVILGIILIVAYQKKKQQV